MKIKSKLSKQIIQGLPLSVEVMNNNVSHIDCTTPIVSVGHEITIKGVRRLTKNFKQSLFNNLITQSVYRSDVYIAYIDVSVDTFNASERANLKLHVTLYGHGELEKVLTDPIRKLLGCSWCKFKELDENQSTYFQV